MVTESISFLSEGERIDGNFSSPCKGAPLILMSHGLESSKDGRKWLFLERRSHREGFATLRFTYRGCGRFGGFEDTTLARRVRDYKAAIDFLESKASIERLGVIGSSFGGRAAIAAKDRRIKAMALLATPFNLDLPIVEKDGRIELESGRVLKSEFFEDLKRYSTSEDLKAIKCPLLIIHGSKDEVVPLGDAHEIYKEANEPKRIEILEGGDHTFSDHLERVAEICLDWFRKYLK